MPSNFSAFCTKYHKTEKKMDETKHSERQNSSNFLLLFSYVLQHITFLICCEKFIQKRHSTFIGGKRCRVHKIIFSERCFFVLSWAQEKEKKIESALRCPTTEHEDSMVSKAHHEVHIWRASCILLGSAMPIASCFVNRIRKTVPFISFYLQISF